MTRPIFLPTLCGAALAALCLAVGCGEESGSAQCSAGDLELYDIRDGGTMDPDVARKLAEEGCITLPVAPSQRQPQPAAAGAAND